MKNKEKKIRIQYNDIWDIIVKHYGNTRIIIYSPIDTTVPKIKIL